MNNDNRLRPTVYCDDLQDCPELQEPPGHRAATRVALGQFGSTGAHEGN